MGDLRSVFETSAFHRFKNIGEELKQYLFEREEAIDIVLISLLCKRDAIFISLPGTAKSMLFDLVCRAISGRYFYILLHKGTPPDFVVGQPSIRILRERDLLKHRIEGMLPEAHVAFLDETFSGNQAVLQATNTILADRFFQNADERVKTPLISAFGATNELPDFYDEPALRAVYDRFLFRLVLTSIEEKENFIKLLKTKPPEELSFKIRLEELAPLQEAVRWVVIPHEIYEVVWALRKRIVEEEIWVSDRRWQWSMNAPRASAFLRQHEKVGLEDLLILQHILWSDPGEERLKVAEIVIEVVFPIFHQALKFLAAAYDALLIVQIPMKGMEKRREQLVEIKNIRVSVIDLMSRAQIGFERESIDEILTAVDEIAAEIQRIVQSFDQNDSGEGGNDDEPPRNSFGPL